jgi:hypothetical protein
MYSCVFGMLGILEPHRFMLWLILVDFGRFWSIQGVEGGNTLRPGAGVGTEFCNSIQFNAGQTCL